MKTEVLRDGNAKLGDRRVLPAAPGAANDPLLDL
jgi:hypothetical protein